jgi:hypothetical protein
MLDIADKLMYIRCTIKRKGVHTMKEGDIVTIYLDPVTEKNPEGSARLLERLRDTRFTQEYWQVRFLSDCFVAARWIKKEVI